MFIFDKNETVKDAVRRFDESFGLQKNITSWIEYRGLPEACRDAFFEGEIGSYLIPEYAGGGAHSMFDRLVCMMQLTRRAGATLPFLSEVTDYALLVGFKWHVPDSDGARRMLPMKGSRPIFSEAFTEPSFFEGVDDLTTHVSLDGSGKPLLNGHKTFVPNGEFEDFVIVLVEDEIFGAEDGGVSLWRVPLSADGVSTAPVAARGQSILLPADVAFENVELDEAWRIGVNGKLSLVLRRQYELRCLFMSAVDLGLARAAFDDAVGFLDRCRDASLPMERAVPVEAAMQDMRVDLEAMELFVQHAAGVMDADDERELYFACRSLMHFVPKKALEVCDRSMRIFGLHGYSSDARVGRILDDCRCNYLRQSGEQIMLSVLSEMFG